MTIKPYKKKDGKTYYYFRVYLGIDEQGKEIKVSRSGYTSRREAQMECNKIISDYERKSDNNFLFEEVYNEWISVYQPLVKGSTFRRVEHAFENHILPIFSKYYIRDITMRDAQKAMDEWSTKMTAPDKIKKMAVQLFRYAQKMGYVSNQPFSHIRAPRVEKESSINYYDRYQLNEFLKLVDAYPHEKWRVFFHLLAHTGMRRGEALALEWSDIDFEKSTVRIGKTVAIGADGKQTINSPKTSAGYRTITISKSMMRRLKQYKQSVKSKLVFPNTKGHTISLSDPGQRMSTILKQSTLPPLSPHGLRHTHCCLLLEAGASIIQVQNRLGHKSAMITLDIYNHITKQKEQEVSNKFEKYLKVGQFFGQR